MGVSFYKRGPSWRMRFRKKGYDELAISFHAKKEAEEWADLHYESWLENPEEYKEWVKKNRESVKKKGIFHKVMKLK